ncbi:MAG: STAS domain-containing protein [Ignavibacteriae bacterium]|nr:STAS domain-containing protein [Ignavibacteriota bacterium]
MTSTNNQSLKAVIVLPNQVIGGADALEFSADIRKFVERNVQLIIVDMSAVELINSSGLGMLVSGLSLMRKIGGLLVLAAVPDKVQGLLGMTHLNTVFQSYPTIQQAEESI